MAKWTLRRETRTRQVTNALLSCNGRLSHDRCVTLGAMAQPDKRLKRDEVVSSLAGVGHYLMLYLIPQLVLLETIRHYVSRRSDKIVSKRNHACAVFDL